jgi:phosphoribosylformylglycinamidine cyclo-ligase
MTYADSGVDIKKANQLVNRIKSIAKSTPRSGVMGEIGGFGGLFSLNLANISNPVLVSATDGVGTKLKIAFQMDKHNTIGIDLVAMCVNDIIVQGAEPLFFLDYLATAKLAPEQAVAVVRGITEGCKQANCALLGGETAEMPGMYSAGEYDLAGFAVGVVDNDKIIDGSTIKKGDQIIGIASSGLHSNGFSLARKVFIDTLGLDLNSQPNDLDQSLGAELLTPTRIYVKAILNLLRDFNIKGIAHITGGGLLENIPRILPQQCKAVIQRNSWEKPVIFEMLRQGGHIEEEEMYRTFNYGIGMTLVVSPLETEDIIDRLAALGERACIIGEIQPAEDPCVELV